MKTQFLKIDSMNGIKKMVFPIVLKYLLSQALNLCTAGLIIINYKSFVYNFVKWLVQ